MSGRWLETDATGAADSELPPDSSSGTVLCTSHQPAPNAVTRMTTSKAKRGNTRPGLIVRPG